MYEHITENNEPMNLATLEVLGACLDIDYEEFWHTLISQTPAKIPDVTAKEPVSFDIPDNILTTDGYWKPHLNNAEYLAFVREIGMTNPASLSINSAVVDDHLFGPMKYDAYYKGLVTCGFFMKTLYEEMPRGRTLFANTAGQINLFNEFMLIYTDIIEREPFNGFLTPILAIVKTEGTIGQSTRYKATRIQYKYVTQKEISTMKILIASPRGDPVPFQRGPAILQLHFKADRASQIF
jgi:hypothetical protein